MLKLNSSFWKIKGFSLLELLVSVALLGLVLSLLYGAFFQISNSTVKVKNTLETRQELRLLIKIILDDLQAVRFLKNFAHQTGLIAEMELGPPDSETGNLIEVSRINFHAAIPSRFYPEAKNQDPELHEVGYTLSQNIDTKEWEFSRREDFYIDGNIRDGGKAHVLSKTVTKFQIELLESETQLAGGGNQETWTNEWNSDEEDVKGCFEKGEPYCLPSAIKLTMSLKGKDGIEVTDSQVVNLCIPLHLCDDRIYPIP